MSSHFALADKVDPLQFELKSVLSRYLCVATAGLLEESVWLLLSDYVSKKAHRYIAQFLEARVKKLTNLKSEKLLSVLNELDDTLREELELYLDERRKSGLNSLIALRHKVAHGDTAVGISLNGVRGYKDVVFEILDKLEEMFDKIMAD